MSRFMIFQAGVSEEALGLLDQAAADGLRPNVFLYTAAMSALAAADAMGGVEDGRTLSAETLKKLRLLRGRMLTAVSI